MGYTGDHSKAKGNFKYAIEEANPNCVGYLKLNNSDYTLWREQNIGSLIIPKEITSMDVAELYPEVKRTRGFNQTIHILITIECLKLFMMQAKTKQAEKVRLYYVDLEKLIKLYDEYQTSMRRQCDIMSTTCVPEAITSDMSVYIEEINRLKEEKASLIEEKTSLLEDKNRLNNCLDEHVQKQLFRSKAESLYIIAVDARVGHFKISMIDEGGPVLHEVKCGCAKYLNGKVRHILQNFLVPPMNEFYQIIYYRLVQVITILADNADENEGLSNEILLELEHLKRTQNVIDYTVGIPESYWNATPAATTQPTDDFDVDAYLLSLIDEDIATMAALAAAQETPMVDPAPPAEVAPIVEPILPIAPPPAEVAPIVEPAPVVDEIIIMGIPKEELVKIIDEAIAESIKDGKINKGDFDRAVKRRLPKGKKSKFSVHICRDIVSVAITRAGVSVGWMK
jgi:uncharacterized protein (UPF0335 family)